MQANKQRGIQVPSSQAQQGGKQAFMSRMLDHLSRPFVRLGFYFVEKIMLRVMNEIARSHRDGNSDLRFFYLEKGRRSR